MHAVLSESDMRHRLHEQLSSLGFSSWLRSVTLEGNAAGSEMFFYRRDGLPKREKPGSLIQRIARAIVSEWKGMADLLDSSYKETAGVAVHIHRQGGKAFVDAVISIYSTVRREWPTATPDFIDPLSGFKFEGAPAPEKPANFVPHDEALLAQFTVGDLFGGSVDLATAFISPPPRGQQRLGSASSPVNTQ